MRFKGRMFLAMAMTVAGTGLKAQVDSNVTLLYHWSDTTLPGSSNYNNTYNEIWGVTVSGREYAIIGSTMGTHFFDVTDPANGSQVDFVPGAAKGTNIVHRDYHDYGGYLYMVCDEGESSLQIADLSYLPDSVHVVYDSRVLFKRSHNVFIDSATARLYVCSVFSDARGYNGLEVYSLKNPLLPRLMIAYPDIGTVHDIFVKNDTAYCHNGNKGLIVIDFSDTTAIQTLGSLEFYPDKGYNHSGWLTEDGNHYVMADENHGLDLKMLDVKDFSDIKVTATFGSGVDVNSMAHNPLIRGNYAFVAYYHDGFQLFDISDPAQPVKVGYYRTYSPGDHVSYRGAWGCYPFLPSGNVLVSDMQYGLFVLDVSQAISVGMDRPHDIGQLRIYPNPFQQDIYVDWPENTDIDDARISLVGVDGKTVFEGRLSSHRIALPALPGGFYSFVLESPAGRTVRKLIRIP